MPLMPVDVQRRSRGFMQLRLADDCRKPGPNLKDPLAYSLELVG